MIGRPSIPWSATASTTPPPTRPSSSAGGSAGPRPTSAWPPASCSTPWTSTAPPAWPPSASSHGAADLRLPGPLVATGGGGWHHWFAPTGLGNRPPRGLAHVDWRGKGGCVLAPPSRHVSGGSYRWLRGLDQAPLPEVPAALRALLDPDPPTPTGRPTRTAARTGRQPATRTAAGCWPPSWPPSAGPPPASATAPSTRPRSRSTATSPAASSTSRTSPLAFTTAALAIGLDRGRDRPHPRLGPHRRPGQPPHRPGPTRPQPPGGRAMTGRWTYRTSAAGVLVLAAAAFTLSYDALHQLALDSRVRPALAWLWPVVIDGTIVVALLTVLAAKRAAARAGYPWALAGLFSAASVAFNIAHAPDRPVAQLVFAMAPVALVLTTHLLMQQVGWRRATPGPTAPVAEQQAGPEPAHPHRPGDHPAPEPHARIRAHRLARVPGCGRPMRPRSQPARPRPAPAWPGPPASASGTGNACSPSSPPTRPAPATPTATAQRAADHRPIATPKGGDHGRAVDRAGGRRPAGHLAAVRAPAHLRAPHRLHQARPARAHRRQRPGRLHRRRPHRGRLQVPNSPKRRSA